MHGSPQCEGDDMKLGYKASAEQFGPGQLLDFACEAEAVGFDSVFVSDHFQPWRHTNGHAPYSLAWLGALGAKTSRVVMGTSVLTPSFRYHPSIVAQAFGTLGVMFPGRVVLGIGTGESLNEVPATGMAWPEMKERFARLRESVRLIKQLWAEERVSFEGDYYKTADATIYDRPDVPVPIFVAAGGPMVAKYAGRAGDGFICTSGKATSLYTEKLIPGVEEGLKLSGRPANAIERMIEVKVSFDTDLDRAREDTRHWAALALSPEEKMSVEDPLAMEKLADALPVERAASRWIVSTDADEHVEEIGKYVKLGFDHLVFHAPGPDQSRFLQLYGEVVLPRLRAAFG
jgi:coenzyme F420-dependent glucose-6-phosphate dehydrogenase